MSNEKEVERGLRMTEKEEVKIIDSYPDKKDNGETVSVHGKAVRINDIIRVSASSGNGTILGKVTFLSPMKKFVVVKTAYGYPTTVTADTGGYKSV